MIYPRRDNRHAQRTTNFKIGLILAALGFAYSCSSGSNQTLGNLEFNLERNAILVQVTLNHEGPFTLLVDTGSDPSVVDSTLAEELTWPTVGIGSQGTGAGGRSTEVSILPPLAVQFGTPAPERKMFLGVDLTSISERLGHSVHGILGYNVLADKRVVIDFPNRQIRFGQDDDGREVLPYLPMFINSDDPMPIVHDLLFVNGVALQASIDTGFNGGLVLTSSGMTRLDLAPKSSDSCKDSLGYGGTVTRCVVVLENVRIGNWDVGDIETLYDPMMTTVSGEAEAKIGNALLSDYEVVFDYINKQFGISK